MNVDKLNKSIIWINSFFIFSGFQIFLVFFYILDKPELTRFYSLPLRIFLFLSILLYFRYNKINFKHQRINYLILFLFSFLYIIKVIISDINSYENPLLSKNWYEYIFYYLLFCVTVYVFYSSINYKKYFLSITQPIILSGLLFGLATLIVYFPYIITGTLGRLSNLKYETGEETINPLALAYSAVLTLSSILFLFLFSPKKLTFSNKVYYIISIIISLGMFSIGSSRGALLALLVVLISMIYYTKKKIRIYLISGTIFFITVFVIINNILGGNIFERSTASIDNGDDSGRSVLHDAALQEFSRHPIFGGQIEVSGIYPHNIFIELLMATGIVGLLLFLVFLFKHIFKILKYNQKNVIYSYIFIMFLNGFVQYNFSGAIWGSILLFFPLGLINSLNSEK